MGNLSAKKERPSVPAPVVYGDEIMTGNSGHHGTPEQARQAARGSAELTSTGIERQRSTVALKCMRCGSRLKSSQEHVQCLQCGARWPVIRGIPRFYEAENYYWGEISREDATALLADARKGSWESSIRVHVKRADLRGYYLDLQRASWLALLGLEANAVALDVGCGYGAITHSLALSVREVHSIEAVPERIEFTQERLRQEGITNVSLIQASATALPFLENSFDLIVANGILEWVGEWDLGGSPRSAQLKFLSSLRRLLKDDGVLLIGIENRFGLPALRGQLDHSGKSYTSIVPRRLATMMVRHGKEAGSYAFLTPNSKKEYRTYTYSAPGYRKLLKDAGFKRATLYWAYPGYNRPYRLVPLDARFQAAKHYRDIGDSSARLRKPLWYAPAKNLLAYLCPWFAHEFVIFGFKSARRTNQAEAWLRRSLAERESSERSNLSGDGKLFSSAYTRPFANKSILHLRSQGAGRVRAVAKASLRNGLEKDVEAEFRSLKQVSEKLAQHPELAIIVPKPIGCRRDGVSVYTLESSAQGTQFERRVTHRSYSGNLERVRMDFGRLIQMNSNLVKALRTLPGVRPIDTTWYRLPDEIAQDAAWARRVEEVRFFSESGCGVKDSWVQHGDFVIGNIFIQEKTGRFEIIDWGDMASGFPPLYDIFTLIVQSGLSAFAREKASSLAWDEGLEESFSEIFLERSQLGKIFEELLSEACGQLQVDPNLIPSLLSEFLLIRLHYNLGRRESSRPYLKMLRAYLAHL
ncbi:MAG: methyltransferase domain-containing protein [Terriglobia bacterium]